MTRFALLLPIALLSCDESPPSIEDAGPCGSLSCGLAMFHDQRAVYDLTLDACFRGSTSDEERLICEQAYTLALIGEDKP